MNQRKGRDTPLDVMRRAELRVLRAAAGCVNGSGFSFAWKDTMAVAHFPGSLKRLESALANLRSVRAFQAKQRRKNRGR